MNQLAKHPLPQQVAYKPKLFRVSLSWNTLFKKLSLNPEELSGQLNNNGEYKPRYIDYFGIEPQNANNLSLTIKRKDMERPFLSNNKQIWQFFEPLLRRRLDLIDKSTRYTGRVKGYLFGKLSSGQSDIKSVSEYFSMTSRTLQRRLLEEETSFRKILDEARSEMAFIYLSNTDFAAYEISFLLGFEDKNSFFRAFQRWTGTTPQAARMSLRERTIQLD